MAAPSKPPASGTTVGDALAAAARKRPAPPAAKKWLWIVLMAVVAAICIAQLFGWTSNPVADKVKDAKLHEQRERDAGMSSDAPGSATPSPDTPSPSGR